MDKDYSRLTKEEIEAIATKILDELNISDFITDLGNGIYKVDSGNGNILYTGRLGAEMIENSLTKRLLNYSNDATEATN
jgi:hypothetical protein